MLSGFSQPANHRSSPFLRITDNAGSGKHFGYRIGIRDWNTLEYSNPFLSQSELTKVTLRKQIEDKVMAERKAKLVENSLLVTLC